MTTNDKLFLAAVSQLAKDNQADPDSMNYIITCKDLLSPEIIALFDSGDSRTGSWFMNVYIEFQPMFNQAPVKPWMKLGH